MKNHFLSTQVTVTEKIIDILRFESNVIMDLPCIHTIRPLPGVRNLEEVFSDSWMVIVNEDS